MNEECWEVAGTTGIRNLNAIELLFLSHPLALSSSLPHISLHVSIVTYYLLQDEMFFNSFMFTAKSRARHRHFPYPLCPYTPIAFPMVSVPQQSSTFFSSADAH